MLKALVLTCYFLQFSVITPLDPGDLLVGRERQLRASSTCGLDGPSTYCVQDPTAAFAARVDCFTCDSRLPYGDDDAEQTHLIENVVSSDQNFLRKPYWWQSQTDVEKVEIELNLESTFDLESVSVTFKFLRPHSMVIEKSSSDDGEGDLWVPLQYYSHDCFRVFPTVPNLISRKEGEAYCEQSYQDMTDVEEPVVFKMEDLIGGLSSQSELAKQLRLVTNIRIRLVKFHALPSNPQADPADERARYFYSISQLEVRGNCFCNGHASKCIPKNPYEGYETGKVYGVCQCDHFTEGTNCERCMPMYNALMWQPWSQNNQFECRECKCNNHASLCRFNQTQFDLDPRASDGGQCVNCDDETEGSHCDRCRVGYHLQLGRQISDRFPCRMCNYDPRGVTSDICDPKTGQVFCKPKVTGVRCDTCLQGYYGLGFESSDGCLPCGCAPGGSKSPSCDSGKTGKCDCRYGFIGQKCDQVAPGAFLPGFDFFHLEAEDSQSVSRKIVLRDHGYKTWTGDGFVEMRPSESLSFEIGQGDLPKTSVPLLFIPFLRIKPIEGPSFQLSVRFVLSGKESERGSMGPKWESGCRMEYGLNKSPAMAFKVDMTQANSIWGWVKLGDDTLLCMHEDIPVELVLTIDQSVDYHTTLQIDSLVLVPHPKVTSMSQFGLTDEELLSSYCIEQQLSLLSGGQKGQSDVSDKCLMYTRAVQADLYNGAKSCGCDKYGTIGASRQCESLGGQCDCKTNVIGRACDQCVSGTYNISNENGCQDCNCNVLGTKPGTFCDVKTGSCQCQPGFSGKNCDQCQAGRFGFPRCEECQCNGRATTCDSESGKCIGCTQNSAGDNCELCEDGFYLDRSTSPSVCRACSCPGTFRNSMNKSIAFFASGCSADNSDSVTCSCLKGYKGDLCTECAPGYFGNPAAGVPCSECDCNGNELDTSAKCDSRTGVCLGCRNNADGSHCEKCADGFHGDPTEPEEGCSACKCNRAGTLDKTCGPNGCRCDSRTGSCYCKPNVMGADCSICAPNHFNISHPEGCQPCECASYGSRENMCDPVTGSCSCLPYYGGRKCDQCPDHQWGNPLASCHNCDCHPLGSKDHLQCNRFTGECECKEGFRGQKCDQCQDGFQGEFPNCVSCGPCYDQWKIDLDNLKRRSLELGEKAARIEKSGSVGEYRGEFEKLDRYIRDIERLLESNKEAADRLKTLSDTVATSKKRAAQLESELLKFEDSIESQSDELTALKAQLERTRKAMNESQRRIDILRAKKDGLAADSLLGIKERISRATEMTQQALADSQAENQTLVSIERQLDYIEQQLKLINPAQYQETVDKFSRTFKELEGQVNDTQKFIAEMTKLMCGGGDSSEVGSCESCGGPRCAFCGNMPTEEGIVLATCKGAATYARKADSKLQEIIALLDRKLMRAREVLQEVNEALSLVEITSLSAEELRRRAELAEETASNLNKTFSDQLAAIAGQKALSYRYLDDVSQLLKAINNFKMPNITKEDIANLEREMRSVEAQVGQMERATEQMQANASLVRQLLQDALSARELAESVLADVRKLVDLLDDAEKSNNLTEDAIEDIKRKLAQMGDKEAGLRTDMSGLDKLVNDTADSLKSVLQCRDTVASLMSSLTVELTDAEAVVIQANATVNNTRKEADDLREEFDGLDEFLDEKIAETKEISDEAAEAVDRATELSTGAQRVFDRFQNLNKRLYDQIRKFKDYETKIDALNTRLDDAWEKIRYQYQLKYDPKCESINFPPSV